MFPDHLPDPWKAPPLQQPTVIRTPDQRLRVFVNSTLEELKAERLAAKNLIHGEELDGEMRYQLYPTIRE